MHHKLKITEKNVGSGGQIHILKCYNAILEYCGGWSFGGIVLSCGAEARTCWFCWTFCLSNRLDCILVVTLCWLRKTDWFSWG